MELSIFQCGGVNALVYLLVIMFGIASWVDINGMFVELPILVQNLPEGWDLPSYMAVIIQIANIAPLLYTLASWRWPKQRFDTAVIYIIIGVGTISCLLLALAWDVTSEIAGTERSTALLTLQFFLALVDCTSSVAFLPFMYRFRQEYMMAYFIGEGFSGLIPSVVALGQGAGSMKCVAVPVGTVPSNASNSQMLLANTSAITAYSNISSLSFPTSELSTTTEPINYNVYPQFQKPRFSVKTFFLVLMSLMLCSLISFTLLKYWRVCKNEYSTCKVTNSAQLCQGSSLFAHQDSSESDNPSGLDMDSLPNNMSETYRMSTVANNLTSDKTVNDIVKTVDNRRTGGHNFNNCTYELLKPVNLGGKDDEDEEKFLNKVDTSLPSSKMIDAGTSSSSMSSSSDHPEKLKQDTHVKIPKSTFIVFLVITAWLNAISNGVLPSIQTYSCLPYGIKPYHLSVTLAAIANPVACFAAVFITVSSVKTTLAMTGVGTALASYVIYTAAASPTPPLVGKTAGTTLLVLCWILVIFFLTYTKVCIATVFRRGGRGARALLWVGAATQVGSLIGAVSTFLLVNVYKVFTQGSPC